MPKPAKIEGYISEWLAAEGHDDLVAFARCKQVNVSTVSPGTQLSISASSASPREVAQAMGRDLSDNALVLGYTHAFVLTRSRFFVLILTGFKERVKKCWIDVEADPVVVHYTDGGSGYGHTSRYLIADLPDGRWVIDSFTYLDKDGNRAPFADAGDAFLAALGDRARRITAD